MLTSLPVELFRNIGHYLNNRDIVTCQCVCKLWYRKWISYAYCIVHLKGKIQFRNFLHHSLQNSLYPAQTKFSIGYQIRKLIVENGHIDPLVLGQLPLLCPYLEVFMYDGVSLCEKAKKEPFQYYQQRKNREEVDKIRHNFKYWSKLREIVEFNGITVTHSLLQNPQQLTHISVQFSNSNDKTNLKSSFIESLANAPLLISLSMARIYISIEEVEKVHTNCPNLLTLELNNIIFLPTLDNEFVFGTIEPASKLICFKVDDVGFCNDLSGWLRYIAQKYIYTKNLEIGSCSFTLPLFSEEASADGEKQHYHSHHSQLLAIARKFRKLQVLKLLSFSLGDRFFGILDTQGRLLSELTLGNSLDSTMLSNELHGLMHSKQRHHIKTLTIYGWPLSTSLHGSPLIMETLTSCTRLVAVHLSMGRYLKKDSAHLANTPNNSATVNNSSLYLDFILKCCPTLKSLTITDATLVTGGNDSDLFESSNNMNLFGLESFTLSNVLFENDSIFEILSLRCPLLSHLSLTSTVPFPEHTHARRLDICLPKHRLKTLTLDRIRVSPKCSVRLGTSRFKIASRQKTVWFDLIGYECSSSHFSFQSNRVTSDAKLMLSERMRARKVRITHNAEFAQEHDLSQSVHVAVYCAEVDSISLSGLEVV